MKNKISIYDKNLDVIEVLDINVGGHDSIRTLYNYVAEIKGWDTVDCVDFQGVLRKNSYSKKAEENRKINLEITTKSKIINTFKNEGISRLVFTGTDGRSFGITYSKGELELDGVLD